jgi:IclR family acetate operon transcriptional repressor
VEGAGRGVLEGAFALLEGLERVGEAGLTALAAESGLPKSSAHRLLEQLTALGAVERSGGVYRMGARVFRLGRTWQPYPGLLAAATGPVRRLAESTGATVGISVLREGQAMAVAGVPGEVGELVPLRPGLMWPWTTAAGKVLVATAPPDLPIGPMPGSWRWAASEIRARGAAFDHEELTAGVCCAAVPLIGPRGEVIASLCAMVPPRRDLSRLADALTRTARLIAAALPRASRPAAATGPAASAAGPAASTAAPPIAVPGSPAVAGRSPAVATDSPATVTPEHPSVPGR